MLWVRGGGWMSDVWIKPQTHLHLVFLGIAGFVWSDKAPHDARLQSPDAIRASASCRFPENGLLETARTVLTQFPPSKTRLDGGRCAAAWDLQDQGETRQLAEALRAEPTLETALHLQVQLAEARPDAWGAYPDAAHGFEWTALHLGAICVR